MAEKFTLISDPVSGELSLSEEDFAKMVKWFEKCCRTVVWDESGGHEVDQPNIVEADGENL